MICWQIDRCWNESVETLLVGPVVCMLRAIIHYKSSHRRGPIDTADAFDSFPENNCADYAYKYERSKATMRPSHVGERK
jgi:hypothetical protein